MVSILILPEDRMRQFAKWQPGAVLVVSILILPEDRMRPHVQARLLARHLGFNPHPARRQDAPMHQ